MKTQSQPNIQSHLQINQKNNIQEQTSAVIEQQPLTNKQQSILKFITSYIESYNIAPSFSEIQRYFNLKSVNSVQKYLKILKAKGYVEWPENNSKRALKLIQNTSNQLSESNSSIELPFLGYVAAGIPLEKLSYHETISVPKELVKKNANNCYALQVEGESMIDEGILPNDVLIVHNTQSAEQGALVIATIEEIESTVKRIYRHPDKIQHIELRPSNTRLESMWFDEHEVQIKGEVVALFRKY